MEIYYELGLQVYGGKNNLESGVLKVNHLILDLEEVQILIFEERVAFFLNDQEGGGRSREHFLQRSSLVVSIDTLHLAFCNL